MLQSKRVGFIGGGAIAEALIKGVLKANLVEPQQIIVSDVLQKRLDYLIDTYRVSATTDSKELIANTDILFLTAKPQVIGKVLFSIGTVVPKSTLVISVVAGTTLDVLQEAMPEVPIIRVMPNTPVAVGDGMAALALGNFASKSHEEVVSAIFASSGKVVTLDESLMNAVTGLSGSGPAYVFVMIDALADAGVKEGLPRDSAITLAAQTVLGAARMVLETGEHPAKLRDMVTSPGGTTIAGVYALESHGFRAALMDAVSAATNRSREMGQVKR